MIANGIKLAYQEAGSGAPVLLLHGFCGSSAYWEEVIPLLGQHYRVIAPDLRGHGDSDAPDGEFYGMEQFAEDLLALLDQLKLDQVSLFGHSLGGYITLAFAEKYPKRLRAFGLIHSTAYPDDEQGKAGRDKAVQTIEQQGMEPFIDGLIPRLFAPEHVQTMPDAVEQAKQIGFATPAEGAIRTAKGMKHRIDRNHVLRSAHTPVLLLAGEQDQIISRQKSFSVASPHIRQVLLTAVGHMSMYEAPEKLTEELATFLAE